MKRLKPKRKHKHCHWNAMKAEIQSIRGGWKKQGQERHSLKRSKREKTTLGRKQETAITQARQSARTAALQAGLSLADADDLASRFVLLLLRRIENDKSSHKDKSEEIVLLPRLLLPLFARCEISRFRARSQRESAVTLADDRLFNAPHLASYAQTQQQGQQRALWEAVDDAVRNLSSLQRDVLIAFVLDDASLATITARHRITEAAAKQALYRARRSLRVLLQDWQEP